MRYFLSTLRAWNGGGGSGSSRTVPQLVGCCERLAGGRAEPGDRVLGVLHRSRLGAALGEVVNGLGELVRLHRGPVDGEAGGPARLLGGGEDEDERLVEPDQVGHDDQ